MKKISLFIFSILLSSVWLLLSISPPAHAQDAPNTNVTKRRPDRPANYSPSPSPVVGARFIAPVQPDIKQIQTSKPSFLAQLWSRLKSFFANFFAQPTASSTIASPTPTTSPKPLASADPTADWKKTLSSDGKYSIKHPLDWYSRSLENTTIVSSYDELSQKKIPDIRAKIEISVLDNPKKLTPKEWITLSNKTRNDPDFSVEAKSIKIDSIDTYVRIDKSLSAENNIIYLIYLPKDTKIYLFWVGGNVKYE